MKIFFDCTYLRNTHTGVDVYFLNLIHHLLKVDEKNEYTILVDTRYNTANLLKELQGYRNFRIISIYSPLPLQVIYSAFFIPFYLRIKKFDVYHNPYFFGPLLKFICGGTRVVITVHDLYHQTIPHLMNKYLNVVFKVFANSAIRKADKVIVISNQTKSDVLKHLAISEDKTALIYQALNNKFETDHVYASVAAKYKLEPNKYILSVGKLLPSKGFDDVIRAFEILAGTYHEKEIKLIIVGPHVGTYVDEIRDLIRSLNIDPTMINLAGYITDEDLYALYAEANMVVVPSHYEGFGFPVLEGMKFGKPVIARNASSLKEIAGDAGLLFNDTAELALDMKKLITDVELRDKMIQKGFNRIQDFSWIETAKKTLAVYYGN